MRVAIFGTGQLARMLAQAAAALNVSYCFIRSNNESIEAVDGMGDIICVDDYTSAEDLYTALGNPDVVTVEKEDVPVPLLQQLQIFSSVHPNPESVACTQNRAKEKLLLKEQGFATAPFYIAYEISDVLKGAREIGFPLVIKSLKQGYDGKNQWHINTEEELLAWQKKFPDGGVILEAKINFIKEISFVAVRSVNGNVKFYPVTENHHENGILVTSFAPEQSISKELIEKSKLKMTNLLEYWQYVGVLAMECFILEDDILVNELAPRVHNSGHWTLQKGLTSQFENHIRAITGKKLGSTECEHYSGMVNILGDFDQARWEKSMKGIPHQVYWYQKLPKPGRKTGHINLQNNDFDQLIKDVKLIRDTLYESGY